MLLELNSEFTYSAGTGNVEYTYLAGNECDIYIYIYIYIYI